MIEGQLPTKGKLKKCMYLRSRKKSEEPWIPDNIQLNSKYAPYPRKDASRRETRRTIIKITYFYATGNALSAAE